MSRRSREEEEMSLSSYPLGLHYFLGKWEMPSSSALPPAPPASTFFLLQPNGDKLLLPDGGRIMHRA